MSTGEFGMKAKLIIPGRLAGLNEYTSACRTVSNKYFAGNKVKQKEQKRVKEQIKEQLKGVHFDNQVWVQFRWYEENRRRDMDNIAFAKKFIFDALVEEKIINTDNWKGVRGFDDEFMVDQEHPRVEVIIYRV